MAHHCHGKRIINLTAKWKTSWQKDKDSRQNFFDAARTLNFFFFFSFAIRLLFLPWGYSFCCESFSFCCAQVFLFAVRFLFLPWGFFAPRLVLFPWQSAGPPYLWNSVHKDSWFFPTCGYSWELAQTLLIWLAFIIRAIELVDWPVPKNAGHFCMSDKWKQSFPNAAFCYNCYSRRTRTRFNLIPSLHAFC